MKIAINSVGYNRPDIHRRSLNTVFQCDGIDDVDVYCYIDGNQRPQWIDQYAFKKIVVRAGHLGLTKNILLALKDQFDAGYDVVIHMEDDMLVSGDYLRYIRYCMEHFKGNNILSVSGYSQPSFFTCTPLENAVSAVDFYTSLGVAYDRADWSLISPHVKEEYFGNTTGYIKNFPKKATNEGGAVHHEQAGMINAVRKSNNKLQLVPHCSRCQNIGLVGAHGHYDASTPSFNENYEWETLCVKQ